MFNILESDPFLMNANPTSVAQAIAARMRANRLQLNLTQKALASRSGVSFASLRRFENTGEIALKSLILIAIALDACDDFALLFASQKYQNIEQVIQANTQKEKKRGRKND